MLPDVALQGQDADRLKSPTPAGEPLRIAESAHLEPGMASPRPRETLATTSGSFQKVVASTMARA